jgi:hypothetical protein
MVVGEAAGRFGPVFALPAVHADNITLFLHGASSMQVNNILPSLTNAAALGNRNSAAAAAGQAGAAAAQGAAGGGPSLVGNAAVQTILAQYDLRNITPNEFSQMLQKLSAAGAVSQQDLQELSGIRNDLTAAHVEPDETVNLLDFYTNKVSAAQRQAGDADTTTQQQQISPLLHRLDWLEKINALKTQPEGGGLSALA